MDNRRIKYFMLSKPAIVLYALAGIVMSVNYFLKNSPLFIVALLCIPFVGRIILKHPFVTTVGSYVFLLPFDSVLALGSETQGTTLTSVAGVAVISLLFAEGTISKKLKAPDTAVYGWVFFIIFALLSITWAIEPSLGINRIGTAVGLLLMYLVISSYSVTAKEFDLICKITIYSGVAATLYIVGMLVMTGGDISEIGRLSISFEERDTDGNQFAFSLIIPFALSLKQIFEEKRLGNNTLNVFMALLIAIAIMLSGSRGGLLSMIIMFAVFMFGMRKSKKQTLLLVGITTLLVFAFSMLPEIFWLRVTGAIDSGGAGRTGIWEVAYAAWKHYFIMGAGLNNFPMAYSEYVTTNPFQSNYRASHNIYLGIAVELGMLGVIFFMYAVFKHFQVLKGRSDYTSIALKACMAGILIASFFLDVIWRKPFWLLWILIVLHHDQIKQSKRDVKA